MHLVGAKVPGEALGSVDDGLGHEHSVAVVLIGDLAPSAEDVVDLLDVPVRLVHPGARLEQGADVVPSVGQARHLGHRRGGINANAVNAAVEPEPDDRVEVVLNFCVGPVQVRLLGGEQVQVPLLWTAVRSGDAGPRRSTEGADPIVGRLVTVRPAAVSEQVAVASR